MIQEYQPPEGERRKTAVLREGTSYSEGAEVELPARAGRAIMGGSALEGIAGACAAALAIISLVGTLPEILTAVAVLVLGGATFLGAGGIAAVLGRRSAGQTRRNAFGALLAGSFGFEAFCGLAAAAGGILALCNVVPNTLLPIAVIVLGACLLLGSGGLNFLNLSLNNSGQGGRWASEATRQATVATSGADLVIGSGAVVLGILALTGLHSALLTVVGVLALAMGLFAGGAAVATHACSGHPEH